MYIYIYMRILKVLTWEMKLRRVELFEC